VDNYNYYIQSDKGRISYKGIQQFIYSVFDLIPKNYKDILIIPPDYTRKHSGLGIITNFIYEQLKDNCNIKIMPALGTHAQMTNKEIIDMFGKNIPLDLFIEHNWEKDTVKIGEIPRTFINKISEGIINEKIEVEINRRLVEKHDLIISIGQVLPHVIAGMSNYSKNILVGCGGEEIINKSHYISAVYGIERIMGMDHTPVRRIYDYAEKHFLSNLPLLYIFSVNESQLKPTQQKTSLDNIVGLFAGKDRKLYEKAVKLSQEKNIFKVPRPLNKVVAYLDEDIFKRAWTGCKAIFRTRKAMADGGELIIIAPGLYEFGESRKSDNLIRKYGYVGKEKIVNLVKGNRDLQENLSVAAHLIHGSSEDRFKVTFACEQLRKEEIESVNFNYMPLTEALAKYNPEKLSYGFNTLQNGEVIFFINKPASGLWIAEK